MDARSVVDDLGGAAALARKLELPAENDQGGKLVRAWLVRKRIPAEWFLDISRVAASEGKFHITPTSLAEMAAMRRRDRQAA